MKPSGAVEMTKAEESSAAPSGLGFAAAANPLAWWRSCEEERPALRWGVGGGGGEKEVLLPQVLK